MRVAVNLASRPYVEMGPLYRRLRIAIVILALLAPALWFLLRSETTQAAAAHANLAEIQQSIQSLNHERQTFETSMRGPQNAAVLRQSHFLNGVFARKAFSWTAVMMDLENVLPAGVQVLSIDPIIAKDGHVTIRMRVSGERNRAVDLVRNLEHSHTFLYPRLAGETAENNSQNSGSAPRATSGGDRVNFDILAEYNPLPPPDASKAGSNADSNNEVKDPAKSRGKNGSAGKRERGADHPRSGRAADARDEAAR